MQRAGAPEGRGEGVEGVKEPVDGGKQQAGVILLVGNEGGVVLCFGLGESYFVGPHMLFISLKVDSEARSFVVPLQLTAGGLLGAEFSGEPGDGTGIGDSPGFQGREGVKAAR